MRKIIPIMLVFLFMAVVVSAAILDIDSARPILETRGNVLTGEVLKKQDHYVTFRYFNPPAANYALLTYSLTNPYRGTKAGKYFDAGINSVFKGENKKAFDHFTSAVNEAPDFANAFFNLGILAFIQQGRRVAMPYFEKAVELNPDFTLALGYRGMMRLAEGSREAAIRDLERSQLLDPNFVEAPDLLCDIYFTDGEKEKARNICYRALRLNADNPRTYLILGSIMRSDLVFEEAKDYFNRAMKLFERAGDLKKAEQVRSAYELIMVEHSRYQEKIRIDQSPSISTEDEESTGDTIIAAGNEMAPVN
ncbi:MAG TPA: hypothetical protein VLJ10_01245 [Candidatus Bathyarchaeia archaeon]|nr:hypothetical protein [Candidatus Bathyarchaeia archaeon]